MTEEDKENYRKLLDHLEGYVDLLAVKGPDSVGLVVNELRELVLIGDFSKIGLNKKEEEKCCSSGCQVT